MLVKLPHWTVVVPPPELVAFAVEVVVVPPEVDDDEEPDADADANVAAAFLTRSTSSLPMRSLKMVAPSRGI